VYAADDDRASFKKLCERPIAAGGTCNADADPSVHTATSGVVLSPSRMAPADAEGAK